VVVAATLVRWRAAPEAPGPRAAPRPLSALERRRLEVELAKRDS